MRHWLEPQMVNKKKIQYVPKIQYDNVHEMSYICRQNPSPILAKHSKQLTILNPSCQGVRDASFSENFMHALYYQNFS